MQGTVVDEGGKPIEGATLRLKDLDRGREISLKSDKSGRFYRRGLQAVEYEMVVEKDGYQPIKDRVKLVAGTDRRFDFKLAKATPVGAEEFAQGVAAYNKGDFAAAAAAFEAAVQKAPTVPDLYVNLALAYFHLKRTPEAVAQLEKAASLGPDDPKIHFQLGSAYVEMQSYDKAIAAFEKGLAKQPDLAADPLALEATSTLGAVYFAKGDNDRAIAQFEKALAAKPAAAVPTLGLAKAHFSKGDVDRALKLFEQVVATHPGTPEATQADAFIKELRKGKGPGAHVGYTICNDVSARDLAQGAHPTQGATFTKGLDTFSPCGPYLTLKQEVPDPRNLAIEARINGKPSPMPNANTRHLTFKIPQIVAYISRRMTLLPGDIIQTGVPAPVVPLRAGDTVEITIERLGTLRNRVAANVSRTQ